VEEALPARYKGCMHAKLAGRLQRYFGLYLYRVMARPLDAQNAPPGGPVRFALIDEAELLLHCRDPELELPAYSVRASFERGDLCVGALQDGQLVGYCWFAFGPTPESGGTWLEIGRQATYSYRHFVRPGYRGRRIAAGMLRAVDSTLAQRERARCVALVYTHNRASIRASARSGALPTGYAACLRIFGHPLSWRSPGAKREGLRFFRPQSNLSLLSVAMRRLLSMLAATASRN
jgi:RimJ/RimL family protein N-acetyltransferase